MAQLRDRSTGALVAEGDPSDLVVIYDRLGEDVVMWDDVGADPDTGETNIDLEALRAAAASRLEYLKGDALKAERKRQADAAELVDRCAAVIESAQDYELATIDPVNVAGELAG